MSKVIVKLKRICKREGGYTLAFTLGVVLILMILGGALLFLVESEMTQLIQYADSNRAYYLAEAGIYRALWELNNSGGSYSNGNVGSEETPIELGGGSYYTTFSNGLLTSVGNFGGVERAIYVRVSESTISGGFGESAALFGGKVGTIPSNTTVWNGLGAEHPERVAVVNTNSTTLNINGYVLNQGQPYNLPEYLGWAYSKGNVGPSSNEGTHFRKATEDPGFLFPIFDSSNYNSKIAAAGSPSDGTIAGSQDISPGTYNYRNLTISGATIQSSAATSENQLYLVVTGDLTITSSTIGLAGSDNWIRILVKDTATLSGTFGARTTLNKEVRLYTKDEALLVNDYVDMSQAALFTGDEVQLESGGGGAVRSCWQAQTSGTTNALYAVDFVDASNGIAVGEGGTVRYTTNGGGSWNGTSTSISGALRGMAYPSSSAAFTAGDNGRIWKSENGGATWSQQKEGGPQLNAIAFADSNHGITVGDNRTIYYTVNGGGNWFTPASTPDGTPSLYGVSFSTSSSAWAVGAGGVIWHTSDGGTTWSSQASGTSSTLYGVAFVDANNGWAVGANGVIIRTSNGGSGWSSDQNNAGYGGTLRSVSSINTYESFAAGSYANSTSSLHTKSGGKNWNKQTMPVSFSINLYGVDFVNRRCGFAVGASGVIIKSGGPTINIQGTVLTKNDFGFKVQPSGGEIYVEGAAVAGYRYSDPTSPGSYISSGGEINFASDDHLIDVVFNLGAMPDSQGDGIGVTSGASLIYDTWREG